jgi:hypothetical protein
MAAEAAKNPRRENVFVILALLKGSFFLSTLDNVSGIASQFKQMSFPPICVDVGLKCHANQAKG